MLLFHVLQRFHVSSILRGGSIADILWDRRGARLFYGDDQGRIAIAYITKVRLHPFMCQITCLLQFSRKFGFGTNTLFKREDEVIHIEKSPVVQLVTNCFDHTYVPSHLGPVAGHIASIYYTKMYSN